MAQIAQSRSLDVLYRCLQPRSVLAQILGTLIQPVVPTRTTFYREHCKLREVKRSFVGSHAPCAWTVNYRRGLDMQPDTPLEPGTSCTTRAIPCHIVAINGTWRRRCELKEISSSAACLKGPLDGISDNEFFLLLWTNGFLCRRCKVASVNDSEVGVRFMLSRSEKWAIN